MAIANYSVATSPLVNTCKLVVARLRGRIVVSIKCTESINSYQLKNKTKPQPIEVFPVQNMRDLYIKNRKIIELMQPGIVCTYLIESARYGRRMG